MLTKSRDAHKQNFGDRSKLNLTHFCDCVLPRPPYPFNLAHACSTEKGLRRPNRRFRRERRLGCEGTDRTWSERPHAGGRPTTPSHPRFHRARLALSTEVPRLWQSATTFAHTTG